MELGQVGDEDDGVESEGEQWGFGFGGFFPHGT
jgi:hypothetical protein